MKLLNRTEVLGANDLQFEDVPTEEWGKDTGVRIRNLTAKGRGEFISRSIAAKAAAEAAAEVAKAEGKEAPKSGGDFEVEALLVVMTAIDEKGNPLFTKDDLVALQQKSAAPISRLSAVAQKLSGLTGEAQREAVKTSAATKS
jgi:hypothetical protein